MQIFKLFILTALLAFTACQTAQKEGADVVDAAQKTAADAKQAAQQKAQAASTPSQPIAQRSPEEVAKGDKTLIENYVKNNNLRGSWTESGIFYAIEKAGSGPNPTLQSTVTCHYKGTLLTGKQFDSSYDRGQPASFPLTRVIKGWQEGIPLLKKGGKGKFIIPSGLAYGAVSRGPSLPANSVLIFDVELMEFK